MNRIPRHVLRALEALAQSPINNPALARAEATDLSHDTLYRALEYPLPFYFALALQRCKGLGGLQKGFLLGVRFAKQHQTLSLRPIGSYLGTRSTKALE